MKLGEILRSLRKGTHGQTLVQVSETTGLSVSFLSDVERGRTNPSLETLEKLARYYGTSVEYLLKETANSENYPDFPGFAEFMQDVQSSSEPLDDDVLDVMLRAEQRSSKRAKTKEDWKQYYYTVKTVMGR